MVYSTQLYSQNEIDALRYSQQNIFGTAKFNSMGGSFGSLGGDFSTLSYNPRNWTLSKFRVDLYTKLIYDGSK